MTALSTPGSILVGDLNVAPLETDVWSHKQLLRVVSHTPPETERFERARAAGGFVDLMRRAFLLITDRYPPFSLEA